VRLVAVTKSAPAAVFADARACGLTDVGESRVQDVVERSAGRAQGFRWHLIGHLQANKALRAVEAFDVLHGIDSIGLLQRVERIAGETGRRPELLLQVNVSGEPSKHGLPPEGLAEALAAAAGLEHARVIGLMTMAPATDDPERARPVFAALAALRDEARGLPGAPALTELSMGMTDDFEVAVEEGATLVRIGRGLVGGLYAGDDRAAAKGRHA
jgi:hypothetical protein